VELNYLVISLSVLNYKMFLLFKISRQHKVNVREYSKSYVSNKLKIGMKGVAFYSTEHDQERGGHVD